MMDFRTALLIADGSMRFVIITTVFRVLSLDRTFKLLNLANRFRYQELNENQRLLLFKWINKLAFHLTRQPCLIFALVMYSMDAGADLAIGVSKSGRAFEGHAWIESGGKVFSTIEIAPLACMMRFKANGELDVY